MGTMNSWILSIKLFLISAGVLSLAVGIKILIPNGAPALWSTISSCMKPPYLYIIINGIIITIAASSRFHQIKAEPEADHLISVRTPPPATFESVVAPTIVNTSVLEPFSDVVEVEDRAVDLKHVEIDFAAREDDLIRAESEDVFDESSLPYNPPKISSEVQMESLFPVTVREKPLVSSRFVHRKPNKITPEVGGARSLRRVVVRPKRQETLESTWKMITEGRHVPLTRHLKKPDALVDHEVPKSETFKESPPTRIRKEPSLSQDELNRKVEAFIHKFNEEMRMQRQQSLNQYMEMINRGL